MTDIQHAAPTIDISDDDWEDPIPQAPVAEQEEPDAADDDAEADDAEAPEAPQGPGARVVKRGATESTKPGSPALKRGKPAVSIGKVTTTTHGSGRKRSSGKEVQVSGAAEGTTMTKSQQAQVAKVKKALEAVEQLEGRKTTEMWAVAEGVFKLLEGTDTVAGVRQKDLANALGVHPTNVSVWAKTWRFFGPDEKRVSIQGKEVSFNDHVERVRMLREDGSPADPETYKAIEDAQEESGLSFAVAKRQVRTGPSNVSMDVAGARDRITQMAAKLDELAGASPSLEHFSAGTIALADVIRHLTAVAARMEANGTKFPDSNQRTVESLESELSKLADLTRR